MAGSEDPRLTAGNEGAGLAPGAPPPYVPPEPIPSQGSVATPPPVSPASPSAAPRPKKGRRRLWIALGVVVALFGLGSYQLWQEAQAYEQGHTAYLAGDCAAAVEPLRKAGGDDPPSSSDTETQEKARVELLECEALLAAGDLVTRGQPADAMLAYRDFIVANPRSPLVDTARAGALAIASAVAESPTTALCDDLEAVETMQLLGPTAGILPQLLYRCGQEYGEAASWADALLMYARFRADFPDHELADEVEAAFAAATLADAEQGGAGELAPPPGVAGGDADVATVVIANDAPDPINIVFSGKEVRVEDIPPCPECEVFTTDPGACPGKGPVVEYEIAPGTYTVVVKSGTNILTTPFRGTWELEAGTVYEHCFFIVSGG